MKTPRPEGMAGVTMRTPRSDAKLLNFCLARLRAWRAEYELYSTTISPTFSSVREEREDDARSPVATLALDDAQGEDWPDMTVTNIDSRVPRALADCVGTIDTYSCEEAIFAKQTPFETARPLPPSYPMASEEAPTSHTSQDDPAGSKTPRTRAIPPLDEMASTGPVQEPTHTVDRLRIPRVVQQILDEMPDNWLTLAQGVEDRVQHAGMRTLLVTEALRGEGATTVASALAVSLARHTKLKALLLDANFSHPDVARVFQLATRLGIEHHLLESVGLSEVIVESSRPRLAILPAIEAFELPSMVMGSLKIETVLARLKTTYDLIVIDGGAIFAGRKPVVLPQGIDATLIVRDPSKSSPELLDQLDHYLARVGVSSLGVIENGVDG